MKNKKDEDEWKYSEELGFPPLKEKYKRPWPGRKPRKMLLRILESLYLIVQVIYVNIQA